MTRARISLILRFVPLDYVAMIEEELGSILKDKGRPRAVLKADTDLLNGSLEIDSLDLAVLVVKLEERTHKDPFANGFIEFRTVGELARLYESA